MSVVASPPIPPAERLACLIDGLCVAIAARGIGGLLTAPLIFLLWGRLKRAALRARRLAGKIAAGQSLTVPPRARPPRPGGPPPKQLPRGYAWLVRLVPATASGAAGLQALLNEPEMAALAHAAPMRRLLRPLCQMLGVPPPPVPAVAQAPAKQDVVGRHTETPPPLAGLDREADQGGGRGATHMSLDALATPPPPPSHKGRGPVAAIAPSVPA